jgi:hypothetical protein
MAIRAGDVDKSFIPFDSLSFSQTSRVVKVSRRETVRAATDIHGFSQIGIE